ncbi:POTRA domain-containing protein, partial [Rhizobium leguminosarum]|uniref:POTRA domain-containing protein n=1 Tax=Rhizobium leguminosarum TaxID=384 RepID=UPI003F9CACD1
VYNEDKLHADEEALCQFYDNRGYADMRIVSSDATLDDATNKYTLTFNIAEGQRYDFGPVTVQSTIEDVGSKQLPPLARTR